MFFQFLPINCTGRRELVNVYLRFEECFAYQNLIGALFVRRRPRVRLDAIISGGGQERGLRSGTLPAPIVIGLGAAARIAQEVRSAVFTAISLLNDLSGNGCGS
jgi:hypothetical protein